MIQLFSLKQFASLYIVPEWVAKEITGMEGWPY